MATRLPFGGLAAFAASASLLAAAPSAFAVDEVDSKRLRDAVTVSGILGHERALQRIANQNGGTRASGTPGYEASAAYVSRRLKASGYAVSEQVCSFPFFQELSGMLGGPDVTIPVIGTSFAVGEELVAAARAGTVTARVSASTRSETRTTKNVFGDTTAGDADRQVVVGAHLDSVLEGPGINDNGSGTSGILEIAEEMSELGVTPRQQVRFAFWGAEESGLLGSEHYVSTLTDDRQAQIFANLNFDMIGSPNYVRFVYDGDGSAFDVPGPPGSAQIEQIEQIFARYFAAQGLATEPTAFDGRSDYGPFITDGIPAGGLFSGAEGVKTPEQAAIFGGTAGLAYDPNYHQPGDTITNLSTKALFELGDAAAHATLTLARTRTGFFEDGSRRRSAAVADLAHKGSRLAGRQPQDGDRQTEGRPRGRPSVSQCSGEGMRSAPESENSQKSSPSTGIETL